MPRSGELPNQLADFDRYMTPAQALAGSISKAITHYMLAERLRDYREDPESYAGKWRHRMRRA